MLAVIVMTLMAVAVIGLFPATSAARFLRRWLVESPALWLNRTTLWRALFISGLVAVGVGMTVFFEIEGLLVYGMMVPEIAVWATLFDVGLLIDALLIATAVTASNGLRVVSQRARAVIDVAIAAVIQRRSARARRVGVVRRPARKPADEDGPAWPQPPYRAFSIA